MTRRRATVADEAGGRDRPYSLHFALTDASMIIAVLPAPFRRVALGLCALSGALLLAAGALAQTAPAAAPAPAPAAATAPAAAPPAPQPPTLQKIRATGVITLAHRESSIPFSYLDANKRPVGYALELCERVVEAVRRELKMPGLRTEYLMVTAAQRIPSLLEGKADLECGNTTNNAVRRKQVAFTMTHYFAGGRLLVRADSGVQRLSDLRGKAIVVNKGSTHATNLASAIEKGTMAARVVEAADSAQAFDMLAKGTVAAYLHDDIVLASLRANSPSPKEWAVVGDFTSVEPLAIMLRKDDPEFKRLVDFTLTRVMIDGAIRDIWRRWFEAPIPPNGVNLAVPMNALMRDQVRFPSDKVGDEGGE
jgi:glutamate/aspartate transport system substrate-binding protein